MNPFEAFKNLGKIQSQMKEIQDKLDRLSETGSSLGETVKVTLNGKFEMIDIQIDPSSLKTEDLDLLPPLIKAAHADAVEKIRSAVQRETAALTGSLNIPGCPGFGM